MQRICNFSFVLQSLPDFEMEVVIASGESLPSFPSISFPTFEEGLLELISKALWVWGFPGLNISGDNFTVFDG